METVIERTTESDQRIATNSLEKLIYASDRAKSANTEGIKITIQETNESITIPKKAVSLLASILQNMAKGKSISVIPSDSEISTQQAADMLTISRPHLVKLLEAKAIPYRKVGSHRRILLQDVMEYENKLKKEREKQLEFLAQQAQDLNLGYE